MSMPILLLNAGSSSIKYQVIDAESEQTLATGLIQKIGGTKGTLDHEVPEGEFHVDQDFATHDEALDAMVKMFNEHGPALDDIVAVGHRTVHGGDKFDHTVVIDDDVIQTLVDLLAPAPLHNPGHRRHQGRQDSLPNVPHVAIFDTAFFAHSPGPPTPTRSTWRPPSG